MKSEFYKHGVCTICQGEFRYNPYSQSGLYCSNKCHGIFRYRTETVPKIVAGLISKRPTLKKYLVETRGEKCELCGTGAEWNGKPLSLQVDHIDGDSDNDLPSNLRLICPNCHTQTDTWCARNFKNSKRGRYMKEYKEKNEVRG